jgi:MFS transporter, UMF1 family
MNNSIEIKRAPFKEIFGWAMFDFANSSYTTVIITVVYSVLFPNIIVGDAPEYKMGLLYWSLALCISYGLVVVTAPVLGAIMDFAAAKKAFLFGSYLVTVLATSALYFVQPGAVVVGMVLIIISNYGFAAGESFAAAFLPDLGEPKDLGKISGFAWGLGYFGGIAATSLAVGLLGPQTMDNFARQRWVGPLTGLFFAVAAIPTFLLLKNRGQAKTLPPGDSYLTVGFRQLACTFREVRIYRDLIALLVSLFFSFAGLAIVITFTFNYGDKVIHWNPTVQVLMFVLTNLTAAFGAIVFGFLQDRIGCKFTYSLTLVLWVFAIAMIYGVDAIAGLVNRWCGTTFEVQTVFLVIGAVAALCMGATQSAGRALVGLFSPPAKAGEFFGLWGLSGKLAAITGILSLGLLQVRFGLKTSILLTSILFVLSLAAAFFVNEKRGRLAAEQPPPIDSKS